MKKSKMMKKGLSIIFLALLTTGTMWAQNLALNLNTREEKAEQLRWEQKHIELGKIPFNKPAEVEYTFTNTSNKPVIVENIRTSCGCTAAKHSNAPLLPGESSTIKVSYSANRKGAFNKSITIHISNQVSPVILTLSGTVE